MSDYLKLADAALADFEARQRCEIDELNEKSPPAVANRRSPPSRIVLLAVPEDAPPDWFEGVRMVLTCPSPAFATQEQWTALKDDCWRLLRDHGADAARLGWSALDMFGCHHDRPLVRLDCMGLALILQGRPLLSLDATAAHIRTGSGSLVYRRGRCATEAMPIWRLCTAGQEAHG